MLSVTLFFNNKPFSHSFILEPHSPILSKSTYFDGNYDVTNVILNGVDDTMGPIRSD